MIMEKKYDKIIDILRRSEPEISSPADMEQAILNGIMKRQQSGMSLPGLIEFLFGWIYTGWVRRSLVAAACILVGIFIAQQNTLVRQVNNLNKLIVKNNRITKYDPTDALEKKLMVYRLSEEKSGSQLIAIPEKTLDSLINSISEFQMKYRDIIKMIESDPELKKIVEEKIDQDLRLKIKL